MAKRPTHTSQADAPETPAAAEKPREPRKPADGRSAFTVTKVAGPRVAGKRVKAGETIRLTEDEARSELVFGTIERKG
jgi:hypothetical protein